MLVLELEGPPASLSARAALLHTIALSVCVLMDCMCGFDLLSLLNRGLQQRLIYPALVRVKKNIHVHNIVGKKRSLDCSAGSSGVHVQVGKVLCRCTADSAPLGRRLQSSQQTLNNTTSPFNFRKITVLCHIA